MTLAILGFGVEFQLANGDSPDVFTTLGELVDASPPGVSRAPVDGTHMGTEARFMLFLSGLRDGGEIPLVFNYTAETYDVLLDEYLIDAVRRYRVVGPDGYYWEFDGFVTQLEAPPPIDDVWEINVTIKVSGKPSYNSPPVAPDNTIPPTISGDELEGSLLTATTGTWTGSPAPTFTYQWMRDGVAISGATGSTYTTTNDDVDALITVVVTATNEAGSDSSTSNAILVQSVPAMPASFSIYLNAADTLTNGAVLPNRLAVDPANIDENILLYDTGYIPNRGAGTAVVHGTDGEWVLWEAATTGDTYAWWNSDTPPAHAYGIRFEIKSKPGSGSQAIRYGNTSFLQSTTITETPSTIEFDFTATGITTNYNTFGVRGNGSNTPKLLVRRIILQATGDVGQPANAAAMPAWASLKRGSGDARKELAWPNGLPKSGNFLDNTGNLARVAIRDPGHTTGNDYRNIGTSGVTLIVACQLETGGTASSAIGVDVNTVNSTTTTSLGIGTGSNSFVSHNPGTIGVGSSGWLLAAIEDEGIHFLCIRVENGQQIASLGEVDFNWDTDAFSMSANVWRLGGQSSTTTFKGKIRAAAIAFDFVSEADKNEAIRKMAADIVSEGDTPADWDLAMVFGDSRLANAIPSGTKLLAQVSADGHYSGAPNLYTYQFATGGQTLATAVSEDLPRMLTMAEQLTKRGRKGIVTGMLGTNDSTLMIANPTNYLNSQISAIWDELDAVYGSENLYFAPFNEIARYETGWSAAVVTYEASMDAEVGRNSDPSKAFNDVVDSQGTIVGNDNLASILSNPSAMFQENPNFIHPNVTGNDALVTPFDAMVGRYRTWKSS